MSGYGVIVTRDAPPGKRGARALAEVYRGRALRVSVMRS